MIQRRPFRERLRIATRSEHEYIDTAMSSFELSNERDYVQFLEIHRASLGTLGGIARKADWPDIAAMQRCLENDLARYGRHSLSDSGNSPATDAWSSCGHEFGVSYVLRGSRLGASVLRRRIGTAAPSAYLDFCPTLSWPIFLAELEAFVGYGSPAASDDAIAGAKDAFKEFMRITLAAQTLVGGRVV